MKQIALGIASLLLVTTSALAGSAEGSSALALAALVAEHSPNVKPRDKALLLIFLNGKINASYDAKEKIAVAAEAVTCRSSNVDIAFHECDLTFGTKKITMLGRQAHELYATLAEAGVASEGAAGTIFLGVSNLDCTIDPAEVKQKAGGGAHCAFAPAK